MHGFLSFDRSIFDILVARELSTHLCGSSVGYARFCFSHFAAAVLAIPPILSLNYKSEKSSSSPKLAIIKPSQSIT